MQHDMQFHLDEIRVIRLAAKAVFRATYDIGTGDSREEIDCQMEARSELSQAMAALVAAEAAMDSWFRLAQSREAAKSYNAQTKV